jgi:hypothetical protein
MISTNRSNTPLVTIDTGTEVCPSNFLFAAKERLFLPRPPAATNSFNGKPKATPSDLSFALRLLASGARGAVRLAR